jgi:iron complex outermembrane receptor protein
LASYKITSAAAFVDGTYHATSKLNVIAGLRVGQDKAEANQSTVPTADILPLFGVINGPSSGSVTDTNYAYRIGPQFNFTPDVMAYATASRGYKGPIALPIAGQAVRKIDPETVDSYEVGLKSTFWNRKAIVNVAVFMEKFHGFQTTVLDNSLVPPAFVLGNAGGLKTQGVEVETQFRPISNLSLSANVAYQDAKFTDFKTQCYSANEPIKQAKTTDPSGVGGCYTPASGAAFTQAAGAPLSNASKWNYSFTASYKHPVGDYVLDYSANYLYRTDFYTNGPDPNTKIDGYGVFGANIGVGPEGGKWRVGIFARNLFDQYYVSAVETGIFDDGALTNVINPEARRTIGVVLDAHF